MPWRAAGTDSSDGLLNAVQNLCNSSNCQAVLDEKKLPRSPNWPLGSNWDQWCLNGGEDFELIVSLPPIWAEAFLKTFRYEIIQNHADRQSYISRHFKKSKTQKNAAVLAGTRQ